MRNIDWDQLNFSYMPTNGHMRHTYKDGSWDDGVFHEEDTISLSIAATCLHYGQAVFEGLKAFQCRDGKVRLFRPLENARRLNRSMRRILGPEIPEELFLAATRRVVKANLDFVPPYGTGGSLYVRPLAIGSGPRLGVSASDQYEFIVFTVPVGSYYKGGIKPVDVLVVEDFDRAAPRGTGDIKLGGNYAASLRPNKQAKEAGYEITLFLDPKSDEFIDEFATSNFIAVTKDGKYVTPDSRSILSSITNNTLATLAESMNIPVETRPIRVDELDEFAEVAACGTAVVITPVRKIVHGDKTYEFGEECGPVLKKLYDKVTGIQAGEIPDEFGWLADI